VQVAVAEELPIALLVLRPPAVWWALCIVMAAAVLAAELVNTSLEHLIDHLHPELHPSIRNAKDCAAAAVLLLSLASLVVGAMTVLAAIGFFG
jgi:diacylglycerol kinase (ATP)